MKFDHSSDEVSGVLLIDKPCGMTSHDIVGHIRRLYNTRRVGHTGTLDPMATGVLVVLIGRAAKAAEYLSHDTKEYLATLRLGITTDTEDTSGTIQTVFQLCSLPSLQEVYDTCEKFIGDISQVPPMYSALKIGGKKLCDIARRGGIIEREARMITVFDIACAPAKLPSDYDLRVRCSGGTYIRTLCADIGASLGCGGVMASLRRIENSGFSINECYTISELDTFDTPKLRSILLPVESLFSDLPGISLSEFYAGLCRNGCVIYQKKIGTSFEEGTVVRLYDMGRGGEFFAIGKIGNFPDDSAAPDGDASAVKAIKLFTL